MNRKLRVTSYAFMRDSSVPEKRTIDILKASSFKAI